MMLRDVSSIDCDLHHKSVHQISLRLLTLSFKKSKEIPDHV